MYLLIENAFCEAYTKINVLLATVGTLVSSKPVGMSISEGFAANGWAAQEG